MRFLTQRILVSRRQASPKRFMLALPAMVVAGLLSACGGSAHIPVSSASGPQLYMSPVVIGTPGGATATNATYPISDTDMTFTQKTYAFSDAQSGARLNYSGNLTALSRGLLEMELTYACGSAVNASCSNITYSPPKANSGWAVELAGQDGGLLQLTGQPFVPLVPAATCPSMSSAETFLFVTLPAPLITSGTSKDTWNPQLETAYGTVDISASSSTVTLNSIKQYFLPSAGGGTNANAPSSSTGACSPTVYGENTVAIPANVTATTTLGTTTYGPQAMMGIGPSGLLVEDNGTANSSGTTYYENALGAGTGAIGLPKSSSALNTASLVSAQYMGFFWGSGSGSYLSQTNWSSSVASFGFSTLPSTCAAVAASTSTMLYGGDFTSNNPAATAVQAGGGYGNCDFAIDLGAQDASTNGLYPAATVYVGSGFAANTTGKTYSFSAVAIAGQLNGKYAIFLIGEDLTGSPNQAWGIYLLQSN